MDGVDGWVRKLTTCAWDEREDVKKGLLKEARSHANTGMVVARLESVKRGVDDLEVRWELEEVIEMLTPPEEPVEEPEEEKPEDPKASDFDLVYDDPRGLLLHRNKEGDQWLLTQPDPYTGQPSTVALPPEQLEQVKTQLKGSPYWVLGAGIS